MIQENQKKERRKKKEKNKILLCGSFIARGDLDDSLIRHKGVLIKRDDLEVLLIRILRDHEWEIQTRHIGVQDSKLNCGLSLVELLAALHELSEVMVLTREPELFHDHLWGRTVTA